MTALARKGLNDATYSFNPAGAEVFLYAAFFPWFFQWLFTVYPFRIK
jgi:hypothetical protein